MKEKRRKVRYQERKREKKIDRSFAVGLIPSNRKEAKAKKKKVRLRFFSLPY